MLSSFRFHHAGVAVKDIDRTAAHYIEAGYRKTPTIYDPMQKVNICFLEKEGMPTIELLEPVDGTSPVDRIVDNNGVTPYHFCYEVDDIEQAIVELRTRKYLVVVKPVNAVAIDNRRVCFLFHKDVGLVEIVEKGLK